MYCKYCGEKMDKNDDICYHCGKLVEKNSSYPLDEEDLPLQFKPISMWGYLGYQVVFSIPLIGWILLIFFAFGKDENINVRNFARSYFCFLFICGFLLLFILLIF